jgi:hypothetical protein
MSVREISQLRQKATARFDGYPMSASVVLHESKHAASETPRLQLFARLTNCGEAAKMIPTIQVRRAPVGNLIAT